MSDCYSEEDYLLLSGIQHFAFCPRQWALIHIEQIWAENLRTFEGRELHAKTDDPYADEWRGALRVIRAMPISSSKLGLYGVSDVVEQRQDGILYPIEYKRGKPKTDDRDAVQLCAQAICLEEMTGVEIAQGALYYGETRHRQEISIDSALRERVFLLTQEMHNLFRKGCTPPAVVNKKCSLCSLKEDCKPRLTGKHRSVRNYIDAAMPEEV